MSKQRNGVSYYIYFWSPEENNWVLCRQRFIVNGNDKSNGVYGQFITSMWLNWNIDCKRSQGFVIAGFHVDTIANRYIFLNKLNQEKSSVPSMYNLDCCKFYEYFPGSIETMSNIYNKTIKDKSINYEFVGYNNKDNKLSLRFDYHNNQMLFNLPDFIVFQ
jgi:hypothetical protein